MTANEILEERGMELGTTSKSAVLAAYRVADDGGVLQSCGTRRLFTDPRKHTTMTLRTALMHLGCRAVLQ